MLSLGEQQRLAAARCLTTSLGHSGTDQGCGGMMDWSKINHTHRDFSTDSVKEFAWWVFEQLFIAIWCHRGRVTGFHFIPLVGF